jgi:uncharacterized protein YqgC (DUF456 family)
VSPLDAAGLTLFITVLFLGLFACVFGLPGAILILVDVLIYSAVTRFETIGIKVILALMLLAVASEALEFFLGLKGAFPFNLSVKGFWAALGGSAIGVVALTPLLYGLGTLIGVFAGGIAGVFALEMIRQSYLKPSFRASWGEIAARLAGSAAKGAMTVTMVVVALVSVYS